MACKTYLLIILLATSYLCESYKILVFFPFPGKSHYILGEGLIRHLTKAGHEVTYVTANAETKLNHRVRIIDVSSNNKTFPEKLLSLKAIMDKETDLSDLTFFFRMMAYLSTKTLENPNVQKFLSDTSERFDLIISEWMYNDLYAGLPAIFQCPFIWFSSLEPHWMVLRLIDEMTNPAYTPDSMSNAVSPFTFIQRVQELGMQIAGMAFHYFYLSPIEQKGYNDLIVPIASKRIDVLPTFEVMRYNVSLILGNSHVSTGQATRLPQNYKAIGGYHIEEDVKPLPKDLKTVMDNAKYGVIYFSMGSNLKSKNMPTEIKNKLLKMFGSLKQTVLWKFEEDLPDRPKNVHILDWAPQQSILSHNNCILFITHGGLLSTTEAVHFGVPLVGIPVFGDQFNNVDRAVKKGFARSVQLSYDMVEDLQTAIHDVLSNPAYTKRVKELSFIYHDRPASPGKELVHWVEHVIRTKGAPHLRSPALYLSWYQKLYLDLGALILIALASLIFIIKRSLRAFKHNKGGTKKKTN